MHTVVYLRYTMNNNIFNRVKCGFELIVNKNADPMSKKGITDGRSREKHGTLYIEIRKKEKKETESVV